MGEWSLPALALIVGGLGVLGFMYACLRGAYRGWADDSRGPTFVLAILPGLGIALILAGVSFLPWADRRVVEWGLAAVGVAMLVAIVITALGPSWWGPRWYRQRLGIGARRDAGPDGSRSRRGRDAEAEAEADNLGYRPGNPLMRALEEDEPVDRWQATLIQDFDAETGRTGRLWLYPEGLSFVETMPVGRPREHGRLAIEMLAPEIAEVHVVYQTRVRDLDKGNGTNGTVERLQPKSPWLMVRLRERTPDGNEAQVFRVPNPVSTARRISETLGCPIGEVR